MTCELCDGVAWLNRPIVTLYISRHEYLTAHISCLARFVNASIATIKAHNLDYADHNFYIRAAKDDHSHELREKKILKRKDEQCQNNVH
jgi:hypothetical protein